MATVANRRTMLAGTAAVALQASTGTISAQDSAEPAKKNATASRFPICVFTKPFNSMSFDALAERAASLGLQGIEAPIRPGGHIEPEKVRQRLPQLVKSLAKAGLEITVMTSNINNASDSLNRRVLQTAAEQGIKRFRMQYFRYERNRSILDQLDGWKREMEGLAKFCGKLGIQALYQNHAGERYMGAALWDLQRLIRDINPDHLGVAYDIRHAVVEGGTSWPTTFRMIRPHVTTVYVKDFQWEGRIVKNVPLGDGLVPESFFTDLVKSDFTGPISLHEEYLDHRDPALVETHWKAIESDLSKLRDYLKLNDKS